MVIRNEARALLSEYQRHIAYANAQSAWGRIYNSLGYDVEPPPREASLAEVAAAIDRSMNQWDPLTFVPGRRSDATPSAPASTAPAAAVPAATAVVSTGTPAATTTAAAARTR